MVTDDLMLQILQDHLLVMETVSLIISIAKSKSLEKCIYDSWNMWVGITINFCICTDSSAVGTYAKVYVDYTPVNSHLKWSTVLPVHVQKFMVIRHQRFSSQRASIAVHALPTFVVIWLVESPHKRPAVLLVFVQCLCCYVWFRHGNFWNI